MRIFNRPSIFRRTQKYQASKYIINDRITVPKLRVVDDLSKQIGILTRDEALKMATEKEVDLILIAPNANPPVGKLIELNKFLYREEKKQREARKGAKKGQIKNLKLSLFIGPADFDRFVLKGKEFLNEGNQLRINVVLKGRELGKKDLGMQLAKRYIASLGELNISKEPRIEGRIISAVVSRKK